MEHLPEHHEEREPERRRAETRAERHEEPREPRRERMERPPAPRAERWTVAGPISPIAPGERVEELELRARATVATAAPLGLAAFAAATFTLGAVAAGWAPIAGLIGAIPIFIVFGGIAQFIAAMWAFRKGETFWATFFGVFGSWYAVLGIGILVLGIDFIPIGGPSIVSVSLGVSVAMFALIAAYLTWAAVGVSTVAMGTLAFLTAGLALLSVGFFVGGGPSILIAAGYAHIVSALMAFYASAAIVVNSALHREALPY